MSNDDELDISRLTLDDIPVTLTKRELYGGAIILSVPTHWRDVSQVRQVPDHQEVFQDCTIADDTSNSSSSDKKPSSQILPLGGCMIVEILERQNEISDEDAASFFFHDLAEANRGGDDDDDDDGDVNEGDFKLHYTHVWSVGRKEGIPEGKTAMDQNNIIPKLSTRAKACSCIGNQKVGPMRNQRNIEKGKASKIRIELCAVRLEAVQTDLLLSLTVPIVSDKMSSRNQNNCHSDLFKSILASLEIVNWSLFA